MEWMGLQPRGRRCAVFSHLHLGKGILPQPPCPELADGSKSYVLELEGAEPAYSRLPVR